jgi:hypothetical protein
VQNRSEVVFLTILHKNSRESFIVRKQIVLIFSIVCTVTATVQAETVYFLVGETGTPLHNDCYLLPLDDLKSIRYARGLILTGNGPEGTIVVANVYPWDGNGININRNYLEPGMPAWSWYVQFEAFTEVAIEWCDGCPSGVEMHPELWHRICFWGYTVVAELGTDLEPWFCNLDVDNDLDFDDFAMFAEHWMESGCGHRYWCGGADINGSGAVDIDDLAIFAENWLWSD